METDTPLPQRRRRRVSRAIFTGLGLIVSAAALVAVAGSVDVGRAARILTSAAPGPMSLALVFALSGLGFRVVLRLVLLPTRGDGSRVSLARVLPVVLVAYLGNAALPARLGEVIGAYLVAGRERLSFVGALGAVAIERVLDIAALATIAFVAASSLGADRWVVQGTGVLAVGALAAFALLATKGLGPVISLLARLSAIRRLGPLVATVLKGLEPFAYWSGGPHRRSAIAIASGLTAATWLCSAAVFWLAAESVGANLSPSGSLLVMAITVLATAIPSAPSYIGTFEFATVTIASMLGVAPDTAFALAILTHVLGVVPSAVGGAIALAGMGGTLQDLSRAAESARRSDVSSHSA